MPATKATSPISRRTKPETNEVRSQQKEIHSDIIAELTSQEADAVTPLMSKIYLTLINAPSIYREREGVLRFASGEREGEWQSAWAQLTRLIDVDGETARRALDWMHERGIITSRSQEGETEIRLTFELDELGRYILRAERS